MIAESVEGELVGMRSSGIGAAGIGNVHRSGAARAACLLPRGIRRRLFEVSTSRKADDAALSPTTSVILMVAITVGLAILLYFMVLWATPSH